MDILFFAALAVFIAFKLREQLGKIDEDKKNNEEQKRDAIKQFLKEQTRANSQPASPDQAKIIAIPGIGIVSVDKNSIPFDEKSQKILNDLNSDLKANFTSALSQAKIAPHHFMEGAKSAFEIILSSFSIGDLSTLKPLLSEKIFLQFESAINDRKTKSQSLNTKIISIDESKIIDAKVINGFSQITISFTSKQINYIHNDVNEIIFGSKTEISTVTDIWTFKKDCTLQNPNWQLASTS